MPTQRSRSRSSCRRRSLRNDNFRIWRSTPAPGAARPNHPTGPTRAPLAFWRPRGRGCAGCSGAPRRSGLLLILVLAHHQKYRPSRTGASWARAAFARLDSARSALSGCFVMRGRRAARASGAATRRRGCRAALVVPAARAPCARRSLMLLRRRCPWSPRRLGGARAAQRRGAASGSVRGTTAARWRASGAQRLGRGRVPRAPRLWFQASLFSHGVGPFLPCVPGLSALKGYKCATTVHNVALRVRLATFYSFSFA